MINSKKIVNLDEVRAKKFGFEYGDYEVVPAERKTPKNKGKEASPQVKTRRAIALGLLAVTAHFTPNIVSEVKDTAATVWDWVKPNNFQLPDKHTKEGKKEIKMGLNDGRYVRVKIDEEHTTLDSLAQEASSESIAYETLKNQLVAENGDSALVFKGDTFAVPVSDDAIQLHNEQYPKHKIHQDSN